MVITMNGETVDFSLDAESCVGDLLSSLDAWLADRGLLLTSLALDGRWAGWTWESAAGLPCDVRP